LGTASAFIKVFLHLLAVSRPPRRADPIVCGVVEVFSRLRGK
jgi:hypothetical protein